MFLNVFFAQLLHEKDFVSYPCSVNMKQCFPSVPCEAKQMIFSFLHSEPRVNEFKRIFLRKLIQLILIFRQFILSHVVVVEPLKQEDKDIQVEVFVALPDGKDIREDDYVAIAGSVLKEILEAYKQNLSSAVGVEVKSINTESDSSDNATDNTMNYIMIPITFALLVVLCCVAFCLHSARYINALSLIVLI